MENPPGASAVCSACQTPLGAEGRCLACLLRGGLSEEIRPDPSPVFPAPSLVANSDAIVYGDFEITRRDDGTLWELGRGAMGITYRAVDRVLHRAVALKVVQFGARATRDSHFGEALRERFLREARAAAALRHANIAGVFQFGAAHESGHCYYAMELVEGETLEARVRRDGPLDVDTALGIASQVATALVTAANRGLIHRDLKPSNIMLEGRGPSKGLEVKIIDFGLAKATAVVDEADLTHGGFVGTPAFASPEQFERQPVDARTDIYSLGVTLWYALTGRVPFAGRNLAPLRHHPARTELPEEQLRARSIPSPLIALLRAMLAEDPAERPASARELLAALENCRQPDASQALRLPGRRKPATITLLVIGFALVVAFVGVGLARWASRQRRPAAPAAIAGRPPIPATPIVPEKSLAVLPFENFSEDKDSAFFADGVQDEVLTDLAKVADLKVISRTSVMPYKDPAKRSNLREIGRVLGVAYVVEGCVQRAGSKIRVNVQLIDARTDTHRWAERYDRDLQDVFAIQTEIAQSIADQLRGNLSPAEKALIAEPPTANLAAYAFYARAAAIDVWSDWRGAENSMAQKVTLLEQAVHEDPSFALAYCALAKEQNDLGEDEGAGSAISVHLPLARQAAETALQLRPALGEAHRELARYYHHAHDFDKAQDELTLARHTLPNDAEVFRIAGEVDSRQNRWEDALASLEKARELDPNDAEVDYHLNDMYHMMRRYREWERNLMRNRTGIAPTDFWSLLALAEIRLDTGDPTAAAAILAKVPMDYSPESEFWDARFTAALYLRKYDAAARVIAATPAGEDFYLYLGTPPESFADGEIARLRGDEPKAQAAFDAARRQLDAVWSKPVKGVVYFSRAAILDAALGRKDDALREARQAVNLVPVTKDPVSGPTYAKRLAMVCAWTGERNLAIDQLEAIARIPSGPTYGELRFDPVWDALRGDPRFEALVAGLMPKPGQ